VSRLSRPWRIGLGVFAAIVTFNVGLSFVRSLTGGTPGGPPSSSYSTGAEGAAAYAELLDRAGHSVERLRRPVSKATLDPRETLLLLDPGSVAEAEPRALGRFVENGGRLVVSGSTGDWLDSIVDRPPDWSADELGSTEVLAPVAELAGVRNVQSAGRGAWAGGAALPALGSGDRSLLAVTDDGGGVLLLADPSPLQNRLLDQADNARLGVNLAGASGRPVRFLESFHGYGEATGLGAVPARWWAAFGLLAAAALTLMVARGRRLGPPQEPERDLPPPRRVYVESLGGVLARIRRKEEAVAPVRERAVALVGDRAGLAASASPEELRAAGERLGLRADELEALFGTGRADVIAVGRALTRLARESPR